METATPISFPLCDYSANRTLNCFHSVFTFHRRREERDSNYLSLSLSLTHTHTHTLSSDLHLFVDILRFRSKTLSAVFHLRKRKRDGNGRRGWLRHVIIIMNACPRPSPSSLPLRPTFSAIATGARLASLGNEQDGQQHVVFLPLVGFHSRLLQSRPRLFERLA